MSTFHRQAQNLNALEQPLKQTKKLPLRGLFPIWQKK